jgi:broad specificity phosphatase PhoE
VTTVLLVRHASHDLLGKALAGRTLAVSLNDKGKAEAQGLAQSLSNAGIAAIYTSPRARALETAAPLAAKLALTPRPNPSIDEIDFGLWTGRTFAELESDAEWPVWNSRRSVARVPSGEAFLDVQRRVVRGIAVLREEHAGEVIALFSHGDVIKAALAHFMHISLDHLETFDIAPASVSVVALEAHWTQVRLINGGALALA